MVSAQVRREQVQFAQRRGLSRRRACALVGVARSTLGYRRRMPQRDQELVGHVRSVARKHPRYGYRRVWAVLRRQGLVINAKRVYRVWRAEELQVPQRKRRHRLPTTVQRPLAATATNQVWAYDFLYDTCANGQHLKLLTVVDEWTRECLAIEVDGRINAGRVITVVSRLMSRYGPPTYLRSDNGPEFVAKAVKTWLARSGVHTAYIDAGKPWQNGTNESFNGKFRDECLNLEWFQNRVEARVVIEQWRCRYNEERPHSSLGYRTPSSQRLNCTRSPILSP